MKFTIALLGALLLCTSALANRDLKQAQQPLEPPQLPGGPAITDAATSLLQTAMQGVTSLLDYSAGDQQKIVSTPKLQPVYCGTAEQAVHLQVTGGSCNVTVFDINQLYTAVTNPTTPCDHSVYNKTCTVFAGTLLIDISPAIDPNSGNFYKQSNPDVQKYLTALGLGNLVSAGMLSVNILFGQSIQVDKLSFLPALEVVAGIPTGPSADFTQPFISQLKINGGGPVPGIGAQNAVPSFSSLAMKPTKVVGNLQVVGTALPDQGGLDQLQTLSGNALVADNPSMASFNAYSLRTIGSGLTLFQNPAITIFAAPQLTSIASSPDANVITTGLQISQNPALAKLSLPMLEAIGGPLIIYNNTQLTSLSSLEHLAVVNATGKSAPAIPIPGLSGPPGTSAVALPAFAITPPSVLIFGNPALFDVAALAKLGRCSSNPTATSDPIFIEVFPKGTNLKCTFTAWAPLCQYILDQLTVSSTSTLRTDGVCIAQQQ